MLAIKWGVSILVWREVPEVSFLSCGTIPELRRSMQLTADAPIDVLMPDSGRGSWWFRLSKVVFLAAGFGRLDADLRASMVQSTVGFNPLGRCVCWQN